MADEKKIAKLREDLEKACKAERYEKILRKADELLALDPGDEDARRCRAVALAKKNRCAEALEACGDDEALADIRAYCQYRLGDLDAALASAEKGDAGQASVAHTRAQVLYKKGEYGEAAAIYEGLLDDGAPRSAAEKRELETNYYAAACLAGQGMAATQKLQKPADPEEHYELAYNRGCCEAASGLGGLGILEAALAGAERAADEDAATAQARVDEVAPYKAQVAYAQCQAGQDDAAADTCKALLKAKPSDAAVRFAATATLVAARGDQELFDSHKRLRPYAENGFADLNPKERAAGRLAWAHVLGAMGRAAEAAAVLEEPFDRADDQCDAELLLQSFAAAKGDAKKRSKKKAAAKGTEKGAEDRARADALLPLLERARLAAEAKKVDAAKLRFLAAQAHLDAGRPREAEAELAASAHARRLGVVGYRADLLKEAGDKPAGAALLRTLDLAKLSASEVLSVGGQRLRMDDVEGCKECMALVPEEADDFIAKKCLLACFYDADEAKRLEDMLDLEPLPEPDEPYDVDAIIAAGVPREWRTARREKADAVLASLDPVTPEELEARAAKKKAAALRRRARKREAYLARLAAEGKYDPAAARPPDPERWIPKKQRSYNKRGRKNKGKFTGAQGGAADAKDAAKLDAKARADAKKEADEKKAQQDAEAVAAGGAGKKGKRTGNRKRRGN